MREPPQSTPEGQIFNSNLQEFAVKCDYVCGLESNGKITPHEAYQRIKALYKELKHSRKQLNIKPE